jgi:hypothetical protein
VREFSAGRALPHIQAGDGAADEHALDLGRALEDREVMRRGGVRPGSMFESPTVTSQKADEC